MAQAYIGTSGWNYREWRHILYPDRLPSSQWLEYYANHFSSVEINYSFYRLPTEQACNAWYRQTPENFRFAVKASRYLTHVKRLRDAVDSWYTFVERVTMLKHKLGPILLQFPSNFEASKRNLDSLEEFLKFARKNGTVRRLSFEFRHATCFDEPTRQLLKKHNTALVVADSSRYPVYEAESTADFVYFRFHGPRQMFASSYSRTKLRESADRIRRLLRRGYDVYAYFNNDSGGHAPRNALVLKRLLESSAQSASINLQDEGGAS
jgi:uncharacterized protein YecE (DUF72 family)